MSTKVEQRIVEMKFDNKEFERRVSGTMSTLDKLKAKLNLSGAAKGLEGIGTSAKKIDMSGLAAGVETVSARFSALDVIGVTALVNITNAAFNAGKRIMASLTIDPVRTGFQEYETQLNAVQTILANTKHKGKTLEDVNAALDELNKYADQTIYNFTEMTKNIGLFTNAGVDLDVSVSAIKGFSNAAAMAGADANRTAAAMYQLSQAFTTGVVRWEDYRSLTSANIAGERMQTAIIETAKTYGINVDEMIAKEGSFKDTLKEQWLTTEIMTEALNHYTLSRKTMTEEEQEAATQMMLSNGYTQEQIDMLFELGTEATSAATEVKSLSQMFEVMRESAQSGWAKTWQIIFGDLYEAKGLFTPLANFFTKIIEKISEARNKFLDSAFSKNFRHLLDGINSITKSIQKSLQPMMDYAKVVDEIISGKWGNTEKRWNALAEAGYDWAHAQNLVNEKLGNSLRRATNYSETQAEAADATVEMTDATIDQIIALTKLSDAELKAKGYTDEQIESLRELVRVADQLGLPLREFIEKLDEIDGRWLFINTFKNAGQGLVAVFTAMRDAWKEVMGTLSPDKLFNIIAALHKFSTRLVVSEETADKLKRTMKGVFAILDLVFKLVSTPFKIVGKILLELAQILDLIPHDILGITAVIGDVIVGFHDWLEEILNVEEILWFLAPYLTKARYAVEDWFKSLTKYDIIKKFVNNLKNAKQTIKDWFNELKNQEDIGKYIMEGLKNGIGDGIQGVVKFITEVGKKIIQAIKNVLGIHSPSTEFYEIGKNIVQGLFNGITETVKMVYNLLKSVGGKIIEIVQDLDLGSVITIALGGGMAFGLIKMAQAFDRITSPLEHVDEILDNTAGVVKKFGGVLSAFKGFLYAEALKSVATGIAIMAGALLLLSLADTAKLWSAVGAMTVMMVLLGALTAVAGHFGKDKGLEFGKITLSLLGLAVAMGIMAMAVKTLSKVKPEAAVQTLVGFIVMVGSLLLLIKTLGKNGENIKKLGGTLLSLGAALLLMAWVTKILGKMDRGVLIQGGLAMVAFGVMLVGFMWACKLLTKSSNVGKIGGALLKVAGAILIMAVVAKALGKMDEDVLKQGIEAMVAFGLLIAGFMLATKLLVGSKNISKIGGAIFGVAAAMLMMALVARIMGGMDIGSLIKGVAAVAAFGLIVGGLMKATGAIGGKDLKRVGTTMVMISVAVGLLAVTAALLSMVDPLKLTKGVIAVGLLVYMMKTLITATKDATQFMGTMIAITVALGILAMSIGLLSMIDPTKLATATAAISAVMGMLALVISSTKNVTNAVWSLVVITLALGAIAGVIYLLSELPADRVLGSAVAVSVLLGTLGGVMYALSTIGKVSGSAFLGILGIAALCVPLYMLVDVLSKLSDINNVAQNAIALSIFIGTLALVLMACTVVGEAYLATFGIAATGLLGLVALIGMLYFVVDVLKKMSDVKDATTNMMALTTFMQEMTKVLVVLALVGPLLLIATAALYGLTGLIGVIGVFAVAIGALMQKFPNIEKFLDKGIPIMVKLAGGIGEMLGAFTKSLMTNITSALPQMGKDLSDFMTGAGAFIAGANNIKPEAMNGIKSLAEAILIVTGTDLLQRLTSFGKENKSIANFGTNIGDLATGMKDFSDKIGVFDEDKIKTIDCACKGIKTLAEAAKSLPGEDGFWQKLAGDKSLVAFGDNLPTLGEKLAGFADKLGPFDDTKVSNVENAGEAIKYLASAAKEIPNDGGLWGAICGENSLSEFGDKLPDLATHLNGFVTGLSSFDDTKVDVVEYACDAIKLLAGVAKELPNDGGLWGAICGENSLSDFSKQLPKLGENLAGFVGKLGTFSKDQVNAVSSACDAIETISGLGNIDLETTGSGLNTFGKNMVNFAKKVKQFVTIIGESSSDGISSAINKTKQLVIMAQTVSATNINSLSNFGTALKKVAKDGIKGFVKELSGTKPKDDAEKAMKKILEAVIKGAEDKKQDVKDAMKAIAEAGISKMSSKELTNKAKSAGKDLVKGFVKGIKDNKYRAEDAGSAIGKAALAAAKEAIDSNSPSKEAMYIGHDFSNGFAIGIREYGASVYSTAYGVADQAREGLNNAIARIATVLDEDMDTQPTIRPVLDLSDVEAGASNLNSMFNNPSIGVASNLNAISMGMNTRAQNGVNGDVVSAINKLRKGIDNMPKGDTINVNGVTYDDGSNIRDAVETIIRAAVVERRT